MGGALVLMFLVSDRDLELMLADRGVEVDHTTIVRWIQAYAAELEKRVRPHLCSCNGSWRVDGFRCKFGLLAIPSGCERAYAGSLNSAFR